MLLIPTSYIFGVCRQDQSTSTRVRGETNQTRRVTSLSRAFASRTLALASSIHPSFCYIFDIDYGTETADTMTWSQREIAKRNM